MTESAWQTAITKIEPNKILVRGYTIEQLMGRVSFAQAMWLAIQGELPGEKVSRLLDAILVSSIDHGPGAPSAYAARNSASTGAPLNVAVASGLLSINRFHGGAIEDCMRTILEVIKSTDSGASLDDASTNVVNRSRNNKVRLAGFGHRVHSNDPRTQCLFELAQEAGIAEKAIEVLLSIERALATGSGRNLPINVDGAIAAILVSLDIDPKTANAFFMMARLPGLVAQACEERDRYKPMRKIRSDLAEYDGPSERTLEPR